MDIEWKYHLVPKSLATQEMIPSLHLSSVKTVKLKYCNPNQGPDFRGTDVLMSLIIFKENINLPAQHLFYVI